MRKISCGGDAEDILELLEASHLVLEGENNLEEVKAFAFHSLKDVFMITTTSSINLNSVHYSNLGERVVHALELPSHWRVPWFDVKWQVKHYQKEKHVINDLLELAKLNFNVIQVKLQKEVKELSRSSSSLSIILPCWGVGNRVDVGATIHWNENNSRRSANYAPNIWKHDFLQSLASKYDKEEFGMQLDHRVNKIKDLFIEERGVLQKIELVDWIQKLGLANYFTKEINDFLETTIDSIKEENLHVAARCFRLLRQHGYKISPDILLGNSKLLNEKGIVIMMRKISCGGDAEDILELLEASHLVLEGENNLEEVKAFAFHSLKDVFMITTTSSINLNSVHYSNLGERVVHALELPSHWRVPWFDVKWQVKHYQKEKHVINDLLELAKLNFNVIQVKLQKEVKELSRWWENLGMIKELSFTRNRLVESFMCSAGVAFEPKYKFLRKWLTKVIIFVLVIDDIYDIHASFEELKQFTMAFERWDAKEIEQLPEYMRMCLDSLKDVTNETAYEIGSEKNFNLVLSYLKKAWVDFCKALFVEAKWYSEGYIPSLQEHLSNAWISSSGPLILLHIYFATTMHEVVTCHEIDDFLHSYEDLVYNISLIIRLCNDLGTTEAERERGDAASSILCYMNEMDVSEDEARKHIQGIINNAWKKINGYSQTRVASMEPFLTHAINAARVAHTLYQNGDGFGIQDRDIKKYILSLVVEPL
ncbi:hypothetical protein RIF29_32718 [Crotalaria pallida]|uniref:Uncharacterized protein n=1 Tax=Crotalaria pallida TaxID=3830 RepID=A0AAN9EJB7_CROPI